MGLLRCLKAIRSTIGSQTAGPNVLKNPSHTWRAMLNQQLEIYHNNFCDQGNLCRKI